MSKFYSVAAVTVFAALAIAARMALIYICHSLATGTVVVLELVLRSF